MPYDLEEASDQDRAWLDGLRRDAYFDLILATFGEWDETRHARYCDECWERSNIRIVKVGDANVGMIQLTEDSKSIEIFEIQIHPDYQNRKLGTQLLRDVIETAEAHHKRLVLSVPLKNDRAYALYERLGFRCVGQSDSHFHMEFSHEPATQSGA